MRFRNLIEAKPGQVGVTKLKDFWLQRELPASTANVPELHQGQQETAGWHPRKARRTSHLGLRHLGVLGSESLYNGEAASQAPYEVGVRRPPPTPSLLAR